MKKGMYFLKDKKAKVYIPDNEPHGVFDEPEPTYLGELWCYTKQTSQTLVAEAGVLYNNDETRLFVFNYNSQIDQTCYILYRDKWFKVNRVDTTDDYNGEMFVYVVDAPEGESGLSGGEVGSEVGSGDEGGTPLWG